MKLKQVILPAVIGVIILISAISVSALQNCAFAAGAACSFPHTGATPGPVAPSGTMNVILILTDDQRADTLQYMANVTNLIINNGTRFLNAYAPTTLCCPSRATFLSGGLYAYETRVLSNERPNGGASEFYDLDGLPVRLQKEGYKTAMIGKYFNAYNTLGNKYIPPGWTNATILTKFSDPDFSYYNYTLVEGRSGPYAPNLNGNRYQISDPNYYITDFLTDKAIAFLTQNVDNRFFLYLTYNAPHTPHIPAAEDIGKFANFTFSSPATQENDLSDKPTYVLTNNATVGAFPKSDYRGQLEALQSVDRNIGRLMQELSDLGLLSNTLIVFASDNGYEWGEHGGLRNKTTEFEEAVKVPLVIRDPQTVNLGPRNNTEIVAYNMDLAKTIFDIANVDGSYSHGTDLLPLVRNQAHTAKTKIFYQGYGQEDTTAPIYMAIRSGDWKYVELGTGEKELYNLATDPWELSSQHNNATYASMMAGFSAEMDAVRGLAITDTTLPAATHGVAYSVTVGKWGGTAPFTWSMYDGTVLPPGLSLNASTGVISGTPTTIGSYAFQVLVEDSSVLPLSGLNERFGATFTINVN